MQTKVHNQIPCHVAAWEILLEVGKMKLLSAAQSFPAPGISDLRDKNTNPKCR